MRAIDADRLLQVLEINFGHTGGADVMRQLIEAQPTLTPPNETPPCYQPDGDGCAYQCYDGDDEPIEKCKECPLCYSDKQRHYTPPNDLLTCDGCTMQGEPDCYTPCSQCIRDPRVCDYYDRRPPEGEA